LNPEHRRHATVLYHALETAKRMFDAGERDATKIQEAMVALIRSTPGAVLDYAELVDHETLQPVNRMEGEILVALAVRFGGTRLIDNVVIAS
jgi:pantoate--beta-alanine ligase